MRSSFSYVPFRIYNQLMGKNRRNQMGADAEIDYLSDSELIRPSVSFQAITFSDGQTLSFDDDEIIVFVGPNNAGKSAALRELQNYIARSQVQPVITGAVLKKTGTGSDLRAYLEKYALKTGEQQQISYGGIGYNINRGVINWFDSPDDRHPVAPFFSSRLPTESRIVDSNPAPGIALYQQPPTHPIHLLIMDNVVAAKISTFFRQAFGRDLVAFRAGGNLYPLLVGIKPERENGEDELTKSFVDRLLAATVPLQSQGDGMRSFATVLLNTLVADNQSVQFLDEPEAFLHPPQARLLGEFIARERRARSQLFIATHSTDILYGLMAGGIKKLRIIRIQRERHVNKIKELSNDKISTIARDTLTRYSRVLEGIFYQHVIITESDSDCLFYNSILNTEVVTADQEPDVLFVHASGKHRMADLADVLRSLDVPVSVIADIDLLNEEVAFKGLFEKLGGRWDEVSQHWRAIKKSVEEVRPPLNTEQVKGLIMKELSEIDGVGPFPKEAERKIKSVFKLISPWAVVKQVGRNGFTGASTIAHYDKLAAICAEKGLWIVPVGEMEGFCRSLEAGHGPAFVEKLLQDRDVETDEELNEARAFVKKIWTAARRGVDRHHPELSSTNSARDR
jgi:hypothetical protein